MKKSEKQLDHLKRKVITLTLEHLVRHGEIDPETAEVADLMEALKRFRKDRSVHYVVDYKSDLLANARNFKRLKEHEFAIIFYCIYFEHWLNHEVHQKLEKLRFSAQTITQILRDTNIRSRTTWLWSLLSLRPLSPQFLKGINELFETRNQLIHYKWNIGIEHSGKSNLKLMTLTEKAENLVAFTRRFERHGIWKKAKKRVLGLVR